MRIPLVVPLSIRSRIRVEVHEPWGISHVEEQDNLITDEGLLALSAEEGIKLGAELLNTCILGRRSTAPAATDVFLTVLGDDTAFTKVYVANCGNPPAQALAAAPVRSIVGASTDNGGTSDAYALVTNGETYWKLTRKRIFEYTSDDFMAGDSGILERTDISASPAWLAQGWGVVGIEASYIKEIGFASGTVQVVEGEACADPSVDAAEWSGGSLWNRIVLEQSIGFDPDPYTAWQDPDVVMSQEAVVVVTLELQVHVDPSENEQVINIAGESTTVTTRVNDLDNPVRWGSAGLLGNLGSWREDSKAAWIGESNTLPESVNTPMPTAGSEAADSAESRDGGAGQEDRRYHFGPTKGMFGTGTGYLLHGNFATDITERSCLVTVFDPKIVKTDEDRLEFDIDYAWSRR